MPLLRLCQCRMNATTPAVHYYPPTARHLFRTRHLHLCIRAMAESIYPAYHYVQFLESIPVAVDKLIEVLTVYVYNAVESVRPTYGRYARLAVAYLAEA